jgi:hypothetical protein
LSGKAAAAAIFAAAVLLLPDAEPALAEVEYPWCRIAGGRDGTLSCGFVSFTQCMAARVGTDMCVQNPRYPPPQQAKPRLRVPR